MKIAIIGEDGLIAPRLLKRLRQEGHEAVAASVDSGVIALNGQGLAEALRGAAVVVDTSRVLPFLNAEAETFLETSRTRSLLAAEAAAGVSHHVALSVVGAEGLSNGGHFRAKIAQEKLIKASPIPYSLVRATQCFESVKSIADAATDGATVRLPPVLTQPVAADDVVSAVAAAAVGAPVNGVIEVAGPERLRFDEFMRRALRARSDPREVVADSHARYFGATLGEATLLPGDDARLGETRFEDWLRQPTGESGSAPKTAVAVAAGSEAANLDDDEFRIREVPAGSVSQVGSVAVFNVAGNFCATQARCTHRQGPLSEGPLEGATVTCPWHGSQFDVCTGAVLRGPARDPLRTYRVTVDGDIGRIGANAAAAAATASVA